MTSSEYPCLAELHSSILFRVANALSAVKLFRVAAPFVDPALGLIEEDLREAFEAAQIAQRVERELTRSIAGPRLRPAADEGRS